MIRDWGTQQIEDDVIDMDSCEIFVQGMFIIITIEGVVTEWVPL